MKLINLLGEEITLSYRELSLPKAKIKCYVCGNESENMDEFSCCGSNGFAHPDCLNIIDHER